LCATSKLKLKDALDYAKKADERSDGRKLKARARRTVSCVLIFHRDVASSLHDAETTVETT
jgi:hypothetical protein